MVTKEHDPSSYHQFSATISSSASRVTTKSDSVTTGCSAKPTSSTTTDGYQFNQQQNQAVGQQNVPNPALGQQFDSHYQGAGGNQVIQNQNANQFGQNLPPNNQHKDVDLRFLNKQSLVCMLNFIKSMISTSH